MASNAGKDSLVQVSDDDFTTFENMKANNFNFAPTVAMLDDTHFQDEAMQRVPGLSDNPLTLAAKYDIADAGQLLLQTQFLAKGLVYVKVLPDGTNGYKISYYVESFEVSSAADGTVDLSVSLASTGLASIATAST